jgi:hypothetical protein
MFSKQSTSRIILVNEPSNIYQPRIRLHRYEWVVILNIALWIYVYTGFSVKNKYIVKLHIAL